MSALVDQIAWLRKQDYEIILVSSGAVACGRRELTVDHSLDSVEQRQLFSAVGQVKLVGLYYDLFREFGIHVGQVLTMKENFRPGEQYRNQQACMTVMLENDVLPIVNENDTVSVTELMFTDNDELSGLIAQMMKADSLILLSNIDGIFTGHPDDPSSELIRTVAPCTDLSKYIQTEKSALEVYPDREKCLRTWWYALQVPHCQQRTVGRHPCHHCQRHPRQYSDRPHREPRANPTH